MYNINIYTFWKYKSYFGRMGLRDRAHKTKVKNKNKKSHLGDVRISMICFGSIFENSFSRFSALTDINNLFLG